MKKSSFFSGLLLIGGDGRFITKVKDYRPALIAALGYMYEKDPQDRILQEICAQLVRGRRTDATSHEWYRLGIDRSIRITNLYEYFLYSMNPGSSEDIPTAALLYFIGNGMRNKLAESYAKLHSY